VLCENTTYDIVDLENVNYARSIDFDLFDYDDDDDDSPTTEQQQQQKHLPLMLWNRDRTIQCGANGSSQNKCILRGGTHQLMAPTSLSNPPWPFHTSSGGDREPPDVSNTVLRGLTFRDASTTALSVFSKAENFTISDCLFEVADTSQALSYFESASFDVPQHIHIEYTKYMSNNVGNGASILELNGPNVVATVVDSHFEFNNVIDGSIIKLRDGSFCDLHRNCFYGNSYQTALVDIRDGRGLDVGVIQLTMDDDESDDGDDSYDISTPTSAFLQDHADTIYAHNGELQGMSPECSHIVTPLTCDSFTSEVCLAEEPPDLIGFYRKPPSSGQPQDGSTPTTTTTTSSSRRQSWTTGCDAATTVLVLVLLFKLLL